MGSVPAEKGVHPSSRAVRAVGYQGMGEPSASAQLNGMDIVRSCLRCRFQAATPPTVRPDARLRPSGPASTAQRLTNSRLHPPRQHGPFERHSAPHAPISMTPCSVRCGARHQPVYRQDVRSPVLRPVRNGRLPGDRYHHRAQPSIARVTRGASSSPPGESACRRGRQRLAHDPVDDRPQTPRFWALAAPVNGPEPWCRQIDGGQIFRRFWPY